ncbi:hypothetical protein ACTHQ1_05130 [Janibacter anophelis]|uniref:hypothetical protein n=1 Tax=Janibacter anophelis TaxID=319054 RepID=UPI003F7EDC22
MARRRQSTPTVAKGVPLELADPDHAVWKTQAGAEKLAARHGLEPRWSPASIYRHPAWERFAAVRAAWAIHAGIVTSWGTPDWRGLEAAGVFARSRGPRLRGDETTVDLERRRLIAH